MLEIGQTIGVYQIESMLGMGGMATVYRAYHPALDRYVALKMMHPLFQQDEGFLSRFTREARIVAKLEHPNIVPIYDFNENNGQPYLVMKYIDGKTLKQVMDNSPPNLQRILQIMRQVANALDYAHQRGVLHRDVKPSNVLLSHDDQIYLTDFGLARLVQAGDSSMSAGMIVGTPNYISPEQAFGEAEVGAESDLYSLAVMLYEMVVGQLPFVANSAMATIHKHIYEVPPLPSSINNELPSLLDGVMLKGLEKAPADRYQRASDLAQAFEHAIEASGLRALSPDRRQIKRNNRQTVSTVNAPSVPPAQPFNPVDAVEKPKRQPSPDQRLIFLLDDEQKWAHLPMEEILRRRLKNQRDQMFGLLGHALPYAMVNSIVMIGSIVEHEFSLYMLVTPLAWGAGLAAHATATYFSTGHMTKRIYSYFETQMQERYGQDWLYNSQEKVLQDHWKVAQEFFDQMMGFWIHAMVFLLINLMLWNIWLATSLSEGFHVMWPLFPGLGWGMGLLAHGFHTFYSKQPSGDRKQLDAEVAFMSGFGSSGQLEKPKHVSPPPASHGGVRLSADGELTDSMVTEFSDDFQHIKHESEGMIQS